MRVWSHSQSRGGVSKYFTLWNVLSFISSFMNNLLVGTASEVNPVLKSIYILLEGVSIAVILAFSLETVFTILGVCRELDALSCITWLNSQLLFLYTSTRSISTDSTLLYIFNHNMVAFLISNVLLCFFIDIFYKVQAGWTSLSEQRNLEDLAVYETHISGALPLLNFCIGFPHHSEFKDFPNIYSHIKTIRGAAVLLS